MPASTASPALARRFAAAQELVREAGALALRMRPPPGAPAATLKGRQDWLTAADTATEDFISARLAELFPEDGFQGEEAGRAREGTLRWVADPIDGTSNFARGGARWCVSLGLIEGRVPLLGVLCAPATGEIFAGGPGFGATLNGAPIRAADTVSLDRAMMEIGWSPRRPPDAFLDMLRTCIAAGAAPRLQGSGALALADVACGRLDVYVEGHINLWDLAGALPILAAAGAVVTPFMEGDGPVSGAPIMAAAPGIADQLASFAGTVFV